MKTQREKRSPQEYEAMIAKAMRTGLEGWAEYLANRFDRDYPAGEDE